MAVNMVVYTKDERRENEQGSSKKVKKLLTNA